MVADGQKVFRFCGCVCAVCVVVWYGVIGESQGGKTGDFDG